MGNMYHCSGRKGNRPFYLNKICVRIYSADELAYCICENPELLERDIFTPELIQWLEEECGVREIAQDLSRCISRNLPLSRFVEGVLDHVSFVSEKEKKSILEIVRQGTGGNVIKRRKTHADFYLRKERYAHAIKEYEALIDQVSESERDFLGGVYHNLGIAFARQFLFEQAEEAFRNAYLLDGKKEHFFSYAAAKRMHLSESEYVRQISNMIDMGDDTLRLEEEMKIIEAEWLESDECKEIVEATQHGDTVEFREWLKDKTAEYKEDYRRYV
ncbi:MAG: hypothetical protein IKI20_04500 [Lachnospiraceae bacterium]|nr:hypothetical protein [Lachnospiraceae bacterium]